MRSTHCTHCQLTNRTPTTAAVMFIGLSAKPGTDDLCPTTNTGKLIAAIEDTLVSSLGIYRTNAVKCAPLDSTGKLRYPSEKELQACLPALRNEIELVAPRVIVPLGGQVSRFLLQHLGEGLEFAGFDSGFSYQTYSLALGQAMPIHHPSYIWVYRRKRIDEYVKAVGNQLLALAD